MVWGRNVGVEVMKTIKTLGFAAVAALSLGLGSAMAQEGPNATVSGSTFFGRQMPAVQAPYGVQSGSSDVEMRPTGNGFWTPGDAPHNAGSQG
jgi:hypothetical protein